MKIDKFNIYQEKIQTVRNFKYDELGNYTLGLVCESGEFADMINQHLHQGKDLNIDNVKSELGLIMWYIGNICNSLDIDLEEVVSENIDKLEKIYSK